MLLLKAGGMFPPWHEALKQVGISVVIFLFVLIVLNIFVFKPILNLIMLRRQKTKGSADKAEILKAEAQTLDDEYEKKFSDARLRAYKLKEDLRSRGVSEAESIMQGAREDAKKNYLKIQEELKKKRDVAREVLVSRVNEYADEVVSKILD